jgi:hypothetical protein
MNKISIDRIIKMEKYIYGRAKSNQLTQIELIKYLDWLSDIDMELYNESDINKFLGCLHELYGDDLHGYITKMGSIKVHPINFPPINLN